MIDNDLTLRALLLPLLLRSGDISFLAVQHRVSGRFANIPFTVEADGYSVDIGGERRRVLGFGEMLERAAALTAAGHDIYLSIARYDDPFYVGDYGRPLGARITDNISDLAVLFLDIEVGHDSSGKPHAYQTHDEVQTAVDGAVAAAGLPKPSLVIDSGSGGAHVLSVLNQALPLDQWLDLARRFVMALKAGGLVADWPQTTMAIAAARMPGTFNWKTGEPRPVTITRVGGSPEALGTLQRDTGHIVTALAPFSLEGTPTASRRRLSGRSGRFVDNFTAGLTKPVTPQDVAALLSVLANDPGRIPYDRWVKIALACWVVVHQSDDPDAERIVHDAFVDWSLNYPDSRLGDRKWVDPEKLWRSARNPRQITDAIFVDLAREIDFWLPSRRAITTAAGVDTVTDSTSAQTPAPPQQAEAGASLLKRVRAHFKLARRSRGLLDAQRTVYRLLLAEPQQDVLLMLRKIVHFLLTEDVDRDPLVAFANRLTGDGEAFVANIEQWIAVAKARSAEQLRSHEAKAAELSDIFGVAPQRGNPQLATPPQSGKEPHNGR